MGCRDFISNLPDEILGKILSLLPTKLVVSTSVLSKRWKNLILFVDNFDLEDSETSTNGFSEFMDKTVALLSTCPIKRLTLNDYDKNTSDRWISTALERGCVELNLQCRYGDFGDPLDIGIFSSNTLVKLTLADVRDVEGDVPPEGTVFFPALKTLSLGSVVADEDLYDWLIYGCPVLEELFIRDGCDGPPTWKRSVFSASIKRLTIFFHLPDFLWAYEDGVLIKTPNLKFLDYSAFVSQEYTVVDGLDLLVEARLDLRLWESTSIYDFFDYDANDYKFYDPKDLFEDVFGDVTNLVAGMRNLKTLHLSADSIESDKEKGWQSLPLLIKNSPNLQTLVIKGLVHKVTSRCGDACPCTSKKMKKRKGMYCLSTCRLKVLEISGYGGSVREVKQMRHFLGNLKCLETVKIGIEENNKNITYLRATIMILHRASSKCNIQFI